MSFAPAGNSANIESALRQMIEQYLNGMIISSAGGDSPKTNKVVSLPEISGFNDLFTSVIRDAIGSATEEAKGGEITESGGFSESNALGFAQRGISIAKNPASIVAEGLSFLPHAVLASFVISIIPFIINELTKPGGPFDLRFKRIMAKEFNSLMDRQTQYDVAIGVRGEIFQSRSGFINKNGASGNANTLRAIREGGINKSYLNEVDYVDHAEGLW